MKQPLLPKKKEEKSSDDEDYKQHSIWSVFKFAFPILWERAGGCIKFEIVLVFIFIGASKAVNAVAPIFLKYAVDNLEEPGVQVQSTNLKHFGTLAKKMLMAAATENWYSAYNPTFWVGMYVLARFLSTGLGEMRNVLFARGQAVLKRGISEITMNHIQRQALRFHLHRKTGKILRTVQRGSLSFSNVIQITMFQISPVFVEIGFTGIVLLLNLKYYFCLIVAGTVLLYMLATYIVQEWRNTLFKKMNIKDNNFNQKATDSLLNFETVKYFNAEAHENRRFVQALSEYKQANIKNNLSVSVLNLAQSIVNNVGLIITLLISCYLVYDGTLEVGDFVMINTYMIQIFLPLNFLGTFWRNIKEGMVDVDMVFYYLDKDDRMPEPADPVKPVFTSGRIEFRGVSFTYDAPGIENPKMILKNVSFTVEKGQSVAIVGPTGSGKSTIMRLLYRFYDVNEGSVSIDGYDVRSMMTQDLRSAIAIVPQDCVLFNDNIQYNIGYGGVSEDPNITENLEKITKVAKRANIYDFIMAQREQWDTKVGERGLRLSGGEKQRVAIARALLKSGAKIYCFDEATSALDTTTEREI